ALIEKTDSSYPAIERLKTTIASAEAEAARRAAQEQLTAEQEAQRQRELERQRQEQQRLAQEQAARELAAQQAAQEEAARREAERLEAERRQAEAARRAAPAATELRAISTPAPRYPPDALRSGTSGEVQVEFTVGVDGTVTAARVVQATPPRVFDREALNAVRRWRFEPVPAPVTSRRTINFAPSQ